MRSTPGQDALPIQPVEDPILCSPYAEPDQYWDYARETGEARLAAGRRPAAYWYKEPEETKRVRKVSEPTLPGLASTGQGLDETQRELDLVNKLRADVKRWRESKHEGATNITKDLLRHWWNKDRPRRLFFCQLEAVETVIYLTEVRGAMADGTRRRPRFNPEFTDADFGSLVDRPHGNGYGPLTRFGCKMATGSGKTVVMAMLVSWAFCNRGRQPSDDRFPRAALVVCPNLTVKERLQVLRPGWVGGDYYSAFDIVPTGYRELLGAGRVAVTNWHLFAPESEHSEGGRSYVVVNKGPEDDDAFARRVLEDLYDRAPLMVLNDEGHHAYRPAPLKDKLEGQEARTAEEMNAEATVWVRGLDRLNAACGVTCCVDLSATPFYIKGSGHPEGEPFPWLVSDFALVDAIESGITKIPRLPVSDTTGRPDAKYFRLWRNITRDLVAKQRLSNGRPRPDVVWERAQDALAMLASDYQKKFETLAGANDLQVKAPPVMILVCDNTDIADLFHRNLSGEVEVEDLGKAADEDDDNAHDDSAPVAKSKKRIEYSTGKVLPVLFQNDARHKRTIRIDSKLLAKAESEDPAVSREKAAEELRKVVSTVGKVGEAGEQVRCVLSVAMLTEGWDANNVTHILGVRAFGSQLLCEQVVGRGLRRMNYTPDPDTGRLPAEYVDVYGIPFSVIPYKGKPTNPPPDPPPPNHVHAMRERAPFELRFPNVEGYVYALTKNFIRADVANMERLLIDPTEIPTGTFVRPASGYSEGYLASLGGGTFEEHTRQRYYESTHIQSIEFEIARQVVFGLVGDAQTAPSSNSNARLRGFARQQLFPQVLRYVHGYVHRRVDFKGMNRCELGLDRYVHWIVDRFLAAIEPDEALGESPLVPILNRYKPIGTTADVNFMTTRPTHGTQRSHVNSVVLDSTWEKSAAFYLEANAGDKDSGKPVFCYVRNERPFLLIPYEWEGVNHVYEPDYIVRMNNGVNLLLEVKGEESEQARAKHQGARRWKSAVNHADKLGRWDFMVCHDPAKLPGMLATLVR